MKHAFFAAALLVATGGLQAQGATSPSPALRQGVLARHLVMITRAGPNFQSLRQHMNEARAHQALYERLAAEGHTIAGGAFEGEPFMGMTIWSEGVDEARARALTESDQLPRLGIVTYEFRVLGVRMGSLGR